MNRILKFRKKLAMTALWIVLGILLLLGIGAALQIDDWSRDLTTNTAETSVDALDEALRPLTSTKSAEEIAEQIQNTIVDLPRWQFVQVDAQDGILTVHLVRRSRLFRFADDVTLRIEPGEEGSIIHARSQSRLGKGDLGQNPRNLKQILRAIKSSRSA